MRTPVPVALAGGLLLAVGTVSAYRTGVAADEAGEVGSFTAIELMTLPGGLALLVTALVLTVRRTAGQRPRRRRGGTGRGPRWSSAC